MTPEGSSRVRTGVVEEIFEDLEPDLHSRFSGWLRSALGPEQDGHPQVSGSTNRQDGKSPSRRKAFSVLVRWSYCLLREHWNDHQLFRGDSLPTEISSLTRTRETVALPRRSLSSRLHHQPAIGHVIEDSRVYCEHLFAGRNRHRLRISCQIHAGEALLRTY
jgi:hypothetical protein